MSKFCAIALAGALLLVAPAVAAAGGRDDERALQRYAQGTWQSFVAMTDEASGLPTDLLHSDGTRDVQTSTTNIGAYLWSAVAAERLGLIRRPELVARLDRTLTTLERMERDAPSGQFYNWYDHRTGAKMTTAETGGPRTPILSSVDNAWLAVGLRIVRNRVPQLAARAGALYASMDFGVYYRPLDNRILFHITPGDPDPDASPCCYDTIVSESRVAYYVGIEKGDLPSKVYYGQWRTFPDTCAYNFQETRPAGFTRSYEGVSVYEGSYPYGDTRLVPSWGGSMFEALMPALFVPEEDWGPGSWRANHPSTVDAQIDHGLDVAGYPAWGFSPSADTTGGYGIFGVDAIGMDPNGNAANLDPRARRPRVRPPGLRACRAARSTAGSACERHRHAARRVPRPALATARGARGAGPAGARLRRVPPRPRLRRRRERHDRRRLRVLPVARPGHGHGRAGQRAGRRRAAPLVRDAGPRARGPAGDRRRGVQRRAARLHDHRHRRRRPAARQLARRRDLRARRERRDPRRRRGRRGLRRRGRRPARRRLGRRHALRRRRRGPARRRRAATTCSPAGRAPTRCAAAAATTTPSRAADGRRRSASPGPCDSRPETS